MNKYLVEGLAVGAVVGLSVLVIYKLMNDPAVKDKVLAHIHRVKESSKERMSQVTEEVALRTAQVTNNPKINQDWVAQQWNAVGW